jgi:hypothetical protein
MAVYKRSRHSAVGPGRELKGPSVPQQADYAPARPEQKPLGYAEIEAVSQLPPESDAWEAFMRDVVQMPAAMTPAVQEAVRQPQWRISPNPLAVVRKMAYQEAKRLGLR